MFSVHPCTNSTQGKFKRLSLGLCRSGVLLIYMFVFKRLDYRVIICMCVSVQSLLQQQLLQHPRDHRCKCVCVSVCLQQHVVVNFQFYAYLRNQMLIKFTYSNCTLLQLLLSVCPPVVAVVIVVLFSRFTYWAIVLLPKRVLDTGCYSLCRFGNDTANRVSLCVAKQHLPLCKSIYYIDILTYISNLHICICMCVMQIV